MRDIGKNIRDLRNKNGMSQEDLARLLFVTRQTVSNYESGRSHPDVETLVKIAEVLGTDVNALLCGPPPEQAPPKHAGRRRFLYWFELGGTVLLVILAWLSVRWAADYLEATFIATPKLFAKWLLFPLALSVLGFVVMDGLLLFLRPALLGRSLALAIRWVALAMLCGFVFLALLEIIPLVIWHQGFDLGAFLNNASLLAMEFLGKHPWLLLFPGAALRLGYHL